MPRVKKVELERRALRVDALHALHEYAAWCARAGIDFPEAETEAIAAYRALIRLAEAVVGGTANKIVSAKKTFWNTRDPHIGGNIEGNTAGPAIGPQTATAP